MLRVSKPPECALFALCWMCACASEPVDVVETNLSADSGGSFVAMGGWKGYAFTATSGDGTTIEPTNFEDRPAGGALCANGTVAALSDYSGTAIVGFNLDQSMTGDAEQVVMPAKAGVFVQVSNLGSSALRVQIQGSNGATDAGDRWCAPLAGARTFIPWAKFNTKCWDNSGSAYDSEPLAAAMVIVPGAATSEIPYDFCVQTLMAADAAPSGIPTVKEHTGVLTERFESTLVKRNGRSYFVQNNVWGDEAQQTIRYDRTSFEVTRQTGENSGSGANAGAPVSYPSTFIGSNYNRTTLASNLPKRVSQLERVRTAWRNNVDSGVRGVYNASYDVWFSTSEEGDEEDPSGGFLMVWYAKPDGAQPIGTPDEKPVRIPGVSGEWTVWTGENAGRPCISYVSVKPIESLEFDLNAFIQHAAGHPGGIESDWYLTNVFAGFEIWSGGVGLTSDSFFAIVE